MAAKGSFPIKVENNFHGFCLVLKSAACEWLLLFFLLVDGAFSFLLTKFAQYCELQLPCILCSRLDHILGKEKPGFYRNLLCGDHKSEMSSLVLCHKHGKLADAHDMCEECLLSYAKKESSQEVYKILVGKLGSDCLQKPFLSMDCGLSTRFCSCCDKPWRSRPNLNKMVHARPLGVSASKPDIPLPKSPTHRCLNRQEGLKKRKDRFSVSPAVAFLLGNQDYDSLYSDVKINSDSESDFPFSDDDETVPSSPRDLRRSSAQKCSKLSPRKQHDDVSLIQKPAAHYMSSANHMHLDAMSENSEPRSPTSNGDIRHSFVEANWQQIRQKASPALHEYTSLNDISHSSFASPLGSPVAPGDEGDRVSDSKKPDSPPTLPDSGFHNNALPSRNMPMPSRLSRETRAGTKENGDVERIPTANTSWESIDLDSTTTTKVTEMDLFNKDTVSIPNKATTDTLEFGGIINTKDTIKLLEKQTRIDCNGIGPTEETIIIPKRTSSPLPMLKSPLDSPVRVRSPSIFSRESVEAFTEIEGESLMDRLKRQVEYYKKIMNKLFKELDEERNASNIAAHQAMAMITKLQEEKSLLHMEISQYLRMMDEQAEYDGEALEKANDLLADKEKEIQDLEEELDYYRIHHPDDYAKFLDMQDDLEDLKEAINSNIESIGIEES